MTGGGCASRHTKVRLLTSYKNCEIGALFSMMITFQKDGSQILEEVVAKGFQKTLGLKGTGNEFTVMSFTKKTLKKKEVRSLESGRSLMFSQVEGNVEAILVFTRVSVPIQLFAPPSPLTLIHFPGCHISCLFLLSHVLADHVLFHSETGRLERGNMENSIF